MSSPLLPRTSDGARSGPYYGSTDVPQLQQTPPVPRHSQGGPLESALNTTDDVEKPPEPSSLCDKLRGSAWGLVYIYQAFWVSSIFALTAPFYPALATSRGDNKWVFGASLSALNILMLPGSFLAETLIIKKSLKVTYQIGITGIATYALLNGSLYWVYDENSFVGVTLVNAAFGGIVNAIYIVSISTVLTSASNGGLWIGIKENVGAIGCLVGQFAGGVLIDHWKYPTPFYAFAIALSLSIPFITERNPESLEKKDDPPEKSREDVEDRNQEDTGADERLAPLPQSPPRYYYKLLVDPLFLVNICNITVASSLSGYNETTLTPYLAQFNLSNTEVGLVFTTKSIGQSFGAIVAGMLTVYRMEKIYILFGQVLSATALLMIGPAPFLTFEPSMVLIYIGQGFIGLGYSSQIVCSMTNALRYITEVAGYPNDVRATSFVSSSTCRSLLLGGTATPPLAAYIVTSYGYRPGSMFMLGAVSLATLFTVGSWLTAACWASKGRLQNDSERQPLSREASENVPDSQTSQFSAAHLLSSGSINYPQI